MERDKKVVLEPFSAEGDHTRENSLVCEARMMMMRGVKEEEKEQQEARGRGGRGWLQRRRRNKNRRLEMNKFGRGRAGGN